VRAVVAGADALCVGGGLADEATVDRLEAALVGAVRTGCLAEDRLAEAAERMRSLAAWAGSGGEGSRVDQGAAPVAARRALHVEGDVSLRGRPPCVVELDPETNLAVGDTAWGIGRHLAARLPGTRVVHLAEAVAADLYAVLDGGGRPLVAVVRDAHRSGWQRRTVEQLLAAHPAGGIVVEMGLPMWRPAGAAGYLATYGAALASALAAAELLTGASS